MNLERLQKIALISKIDLLREKGDGNLESLGGIPDDNPVYTDPKLRAILRQHAGNQEAPYLMKDSGDIYFSAIHFESEYYYIGPMSTRRQEKYRERQFYFSHGITSEDVRSLRFFTLQEVLTIVDLISEVVTGKSYSNMELLTLNGIVLFSPEHLKRDQSLFVTQEEENNEDEDAWRHTYREEQKLLSAVREGRVEDALALSRMLDEDDGRLSSRDLNHWRNLSIVGITLVSRAAIEGGVSPQTAYRISGYYISRCDSQTSVTQIVGMRDYAIRDLTTKVYEKLNRKRSSNYTETCKTYISRHYREKIYLEQIAEELGISPTYLSKIFRKDTGMRLQDYIVRIRVERAANLLRYSDRSLSDIAHYVNFPSQSYFGKVFRKEMHMTPKEYRDQYQAAEWQNNTKETQDGKKTGTS